MFPNMAETVIIKDTWEVISKQVGLPLAVDMKYVYMRITCKVKSIGMESFEKLFSLNSDMSAYLPQTDDFDLEETRKLSEKVRGAARLTLDTLEQVIAAIPDMAEVFNVVTRMLKLHPETGLLEVIGPVFCNTTRHFLLIQVVGSAVRRVCDPCLCAGPLVAGRGESVAGAVRRVVRDDPRQLPAGLHLTRDTPPSPCPNCAGSCYISLKYRL